MNRRRRYAAPSDDTIHVGKIGRLLKNAAAAAVPEIVATDQVRPADVVLDGGTLYWMNDGVDPAADAPESTLMRLPVPPATGAASAPSVLADCAAGAQSIAVDDTAVYYLDARGNIFEVAR